MLARSLLATTILVVAITSASAQTGFPNNCANNAPLPFATIEVKHPIDSACGIKGKTTSPAPSQLQNSVKNNFCGVPANSTPETFTPQMLIDLQRNTHIASGQGKEPADRTELQGLGEGKIVRMKANLIEAHHADVGAGESVNCNGPKEEDNDIHIAFGAQAHTKECSSVSAEISPHFRPASWDEIGHFEKFDPKTKKNIVGPGMASRLQAHPYRITGQLFFDSSHAPCPCGTTCNPIRSSVWEIHPIYNIEVCKAGTTCDVNTDSDWIAFDAWWNSMAPLQPVKPPHSHEPHEPTKKVVKTAP
jgi:hypothetical protein